MPHLLRPGLWRRPGLRIGFYGIRSTLKQQLHQLDPAPPACPAKRCALEQIVPHIGTCACIQERCSKPDALFRGYVIPGAGNAMQNRQPEPARIRCSSMHVGVAVLQDQTKAREVSPAIELIAIPYPQRLLEDSEPSWILARPTDQIQGHSNDFRISATRSGPQKFFGERLTFKHSARPWIAQSSRKQALRQV